VECTGGWIERQRSGWASTIGPVTQPSPSTSPRTSLSAVLAVTILASFGTGILWNGLPFIAEHDYHFDKVKNLALLTFLGVIYVGGALSAGPATRLVERRLSARGVLVWALGVQAVLALGPWFVDDEWIVWVVMGASSLLASFFWPIVESYVSAGRHGRDMRTAMGWWNVAWTGAIALALVFMAPLMTGEGKTARFAIVGLAVLNTLAAASLIWFRREPSEHDVETSDAHVGPEYPMLLRSARILLPLSYVLLAAISPLMPYRLDDLAVEPHWKTPMTAIWMFARVAGIAVLWRLPFWHGRWGTLVVGGAGMAAGFTLIVAAPTVPLMMTGLALFGGAQGVTYFAAIYYAMSVGRAAVDAGGVHEALIGVGYTLGPVAVLAGLGVAAGTRLPEPSAIIFAVGVIAAVGFGVASRPYLVARARR